MLTCGQWAVVLLWLAFAAYVAWYGGNALIFVVYATPMCVVAGVLFLWQGRRSN